ncbi:unnamed protein product, partial [Brugia timori]|uniref:Protein kinase domain-containing protein n=1 Tax=Brugia timori TaxID=42155 RepID=A0A0R3R4Y9_9BILA
MSAVLDRSHLSLPLKSITTRDNSGVPEVANTDSRPMQQKLMKSFSTPADYFIPAPEDLHFSSSSSNSLKGSGSYPPLSRAQRQLNVSAFETQFQTGQQSFSVSHHQKAASLQSVYLSIRSGVAADCGVASVLDDLTDVPLPSKSVTPQSEIHEDVFLTSEIGAVRTFCRSKSVGSRGSRLIQQHLERRDSVIRMIYDGISSIVQRGTLRPKKDYATVKRGRSISS